MQLSRPTLAGFFHDEIVPIKAGQLFYYDAVIEGQAWVTDWRAVANAALAATAGISGRIVGADATNISLAVTSLMDRDRQRDLESDLTTALAAQPEVVRVVTSMLRQTSATAPNSPGPPSSNPFAGIPTSMWIVIGLALVFVMKR